MGLTRVVRTLVIAVFALGPATVSEAAWTRIETANFVLIGDAPERDIRAAADHLEAFHEALASVLPDSVSRPLRTTVLVFGSDRSFNPYRPQFQGRPVEVAGFFQSFGDRAYIALGPGDGDQLYRIVYHEYAHHITRGSVGDIPAWASEGLAGLYETFEMVDSRTVKIGVPSTEYLSLLRASTPMPLRELFSVSQSSSVYNEGSRRSIFYAQSWALTHYLTFNDARHDQLRKYLASDASGVPPDVAFRDAFGDISVLESELRAYIKNFSFRVLQVKFADKINSSRGGRGVAIDDAEADGYLGDLMSVERAAEARTIFERALARKVDAVMPAIGLGRLALKEGNVDEALGILEPLATRARDNFDAQIMLARALLKQMEQQAQSRATVERLRTTLTRAMALEPEIAEPAGMLGYVELRFDGDLSEAVTVLERAVRLAPAREDYRLLLAQALIRSKEFKRATDILGPMIARGSTPEMQTSARRLLQYAADLQRPPSAGGAAPSAPRVAALEAARESVLPATGTEPRFIPALRRVRDGETRVLGMFTGIECVAGVATLIVQAQDAALKLTAGQLNQVEFISYRNDAPGSVQCGRFEKAQRVLATYRTSSDGGLEATAIELLPDGYNPPAK